MSEELIVFTDGSCDLKKNIGGFGLFFPDNEYESYGVKMTEKKHKKITNQRAELFAILEVFTIIINDIEQSKKRIKIYSDSNYSIQCLTNWRYSWERKKWINSKGEPVENQDIIKECIRLYDELILNGFKIEFIHINSHTGKKEYNYVCNDVVDKIAKISANLTNKNAIIKMRDYWNDYKKIN